MSIKTLSPAQEARAALTAQAVAARQAGKTLTYDRTAHEQRLVDMTSFSSLELAAVVNDKHHQFNEEEGIWASGELNTRVSGVLNPLWNLPDDTKSFHRAVRELYDRMDPEVRRALGWTEQMAMTADKLAQTGATGRGGTVDEPWFWRLFRQGLDQPGALLNQRLDVTA